MKLYRLNRVVFSVKNNPAHFLNGLTSNVLEMPRNAFLNIHGRIIATFDQMKIDENEFWIIIEEPFVDTLFEHLDRYIKLSKAEIKRLNKHVYFDIDAEAVLAREITVVIPQKAGRLIITDDKLECSVSEEDFTLFRLENNIPLHGVDYTDEFVLNVSAEDIVSFKKGCFLGQEPVSKVHNRSSPTWQLVVKYDNECGEEERKKMTSQMPDPDSGRMLGFAFIRNKC